jgi:hypothetical protein
VVRHRRARKREVDGAHERRHHATITPDPWDDLQDGAIDAPEGEELMPVTMITSMLHSLTTIWTLVYPRIVYTDVNGLLCKVTVPVPSTAYHDIPATGGALPPIVRWSPATGHDAEILHADDLPLGYDAATVPSQGPTPQTLTSGPGAHAPGGEAMQVKYPIIPEKTAMIVVDMQNDFVQEGAPIEIPRARAMVPRLNRLLDVCRAHQIPVIYIHHVIRGGDIDAGRLAGCQAAL